MKRSANIGAPRENPLHGFSRLIIGVAYRHGVSTVFDDFLTMALCAFSHGQKEELYMETISRYHKNEVQQLANALGALIMAYDRESQDGQWCDILGRFFEEHNGKFGRDARGQFFTPESLCDMMAQLTQGNEPVKDRRIGDCCVGSGRTLIALDRTQPDNRLHNFYVGQDIDGRCAKMFAFNMKMYGMKGVSIHMDTLQMTVYGGYRVYMPEMGGIIRWLSADEARSYIIEPKTIDAAADVIEEPKQLQMIIPDW